MSSTVHVSSNPNCNKCTHRGVTVWMCTNGRRQCLRGILSPRVFSRSRTSCPDHVSTGNKATCKLYRATLMPAHLQMLHRVDTHARPPADITPSRHSRPRTCRCYTVSTLMPAHLQILHRVDTHARAPADIIPYRHSRPRTCRYYTVSTFMPAHLQILHRIDTYARAPADITPSRHSCPRTCKYCT